MTRPVPREAVRIRCGRFPRIHSHMVAVPSTSPTSTGLVAQRITHTASAQGEEEHVEGLQMSAKEIERLLAEALDAFDDPTPLPPVAAGEVGRRSSVPICQLPQVAGHKSISAARSSCSVMASSISKQNSRSVPSMAPVASMRQDTHRSGVSPGEDELASEIKPQPQVGDSGSPSRSSEASEPQTELSSRGNISTMRVQAEAIVYWTAVRGQDSPRSTEQHTEQSVVQHAEQQMAMDVAETSDAQTDLEENEPAVDAAGLAQSPSILIVSEPVVDAACKAQSPTISTLGESLSGSIDGSLRDSYPTLTAVAGGVHPPWPKSHGVLFGNSTTHALPAIQPWPPDPGRVQESWRRGGRVQGTSGGRAWA